MNFYDAGNLQPVKAAAQRRKRKMKSYENEGKMWGQLLLGLNDHALVECYQNAVEMMLDQDFIELLRKEIEARGIDPNACPTVNELVQSV